MAAKLGLDAKLYYDTSADPYGSPTWVEIGNCQDLTINLDKSEADVTVRANNGWEAILGALKAGGLDFKMIYDNADGAFVAVRNAFLNNTNLHIAAMDGPMVAPTGGTASQGLWAVMTVTKFTKNEPLKEAQTVDVTIKPTYHTTLHPQWMSGTVAP